MKTMVHRQRGNLLIVVHGSVAPSDAEWEEFLEHFRRRTDLALLRTLVFTDGAAPNTLQRGKLNDVLGDRAPLISVVSDAAIVRAAGTALSWFNRRLRVFSTKQLDAALEHLECAPSDRSAILELASELRSELARALASQSAAKR